MEQVFDSTELDTDIAIVGGGPVGLALAISLAQAGVRFVLLEKLQQGQNTSRAAVVHAHTLEELESLGVARRLVGLGLTVDNFSIRDRERRLLDIGFKGLPTPYPYALMLPQCDTEQVLEARLRELGGSVHRGWSVESVTDLGDRAQIVASVEGQGRKAVTARYVVGADGIHSVVRQSAGINFTGHNYEESFLLADVDMTWDHGSDEVKLFFSPAGMVVVAPLPGGAFRIVSTVPQAPARPDIADIQAILDARGPRIGKATVTRVIWGSRFRVQHRVADAYRKGRLFLAGDAAHVHSPAGGQGMNTGLVDAVVLGRVLGAVVSGQADERLLDTYHTLRRPAAEQVLKLAGRLTGLATVQAAPKRFLRNLLLSSVNKVAPAKRRIAMAISGIARRSAARVPGRVSPAGGRQQGTSATSTAALQT
jgi:2-polyprenyl-6-methoxyphenol hydroxylase-like FAD-dependent oxidoreductase